MAAFGIMVAVLLHQVYLDRHNRNLQLTKSPELLEIEKLHQNGVISENQALLLTQNCHALPKVGKSPFHNYLEHGQLKTLFYMISKEKKVILEVDFLPE